MKANSLKKMPVVSMADGTQVGIVDEVLFDTADLRLTGLLLRADSGQSMLPFDAIRSIGSDAVMVESAAATQGAKGQAALDTTRALSDLTKLSAVNAEGTLLGDVRDVDINDQDGRLVEMDVHRGGVMGFGGTTVTVPKDAIRSIGPKLVTVDMPSPPDK